MMRLLCRVGWHAWKTPGSWITYRDGVGGITHVVGKQRCRRGGCVALRDYHKTWEPSMGETVTEPRGEMLLSLLFRAPLIGVNPRKPELLHAVTMEGIPVKNWGKTSTVESACGKKRLKLVGSGGYAVEWPPGVRSLPKGTVRCAACHEATGRKRPRSRFVARGVAS